MTTTTMVIVGASIAGVTAAETLRTLTDVPIELIDADPLAPYDRTALSKGMLLEDLAPTDLLLRTGDSLAAQSIHRRRARAVSIESSTNEVALSDGSTVQYDKLLIATGASPFLPFKTADDATVHVLRTIDDARALRGSLVNGAHVVVIGSGLIGCEVASAAAELGMKITLISADEGPFSVALGPHAAEFFAGLQHQAGIDGIFNVFVDSVSRRGVKHLIQLSDGRSIEADVVVAGTGVRPATSWLEGSGLELGNGVLCDGQFRTNMPDIFAAGDVARWPGGPFGEMVRLEHWTSATDQGTAAARAMVGAIDNSMVLPQPYFMSHLHGKRVQGVGHCALADESRLFADHDEPDRPLVLYGKNGRVIGCLGVDRTRFVARFNAMLAEEVGWEDGVAVAQETMKLSAVM